VFGTLGWIDLQKRPAGVIAGDNAGYPNGRCPGGGVSLEAQYVGSSGGGPILSARIVNEARYAHQACQR
jgi:hypothetical protein